ncbi:ATP-binding cassette domain-containing protein (plasmid) [Nitratireductor rhodophyticola]|jgi:octopine/nopaline transport system ATP-binding protein|uniref:ABC transporter ATP-binding protein n=1 Tax=Hyphomicrobiales TaxID=356 RepID=UPI000CC093A8|nr:MULTISPECIES: ATP-binding cassette domain-containing protein [Hyphomicrobiales]PKP72344.1 MAG: histidine/lysine/arginine/ornithine ABC transporter ATP-binding protein [Alphaproteobacteria bacterium HGW-Alphaproteobacteria-5]TAJ28599.1 MAG: ATP-binding cassette domain-containing protein [Bosea sp. (in: a-proteobacteria)]WPZ16457.1 ATP-binding cassette domain-containing protein [Nitratireductor rhodophyticola]
MTSIETNNVPVISIRDLHKNFGDLEVLKGITFEAHEGEVVSILGSSGSGKSTMLRCINMLETPSAGTIAIRGEEIAMRTTKNGTRPADRKQLDRIRSDVAMVFQGFNLWPHMSILENVIEAPVHVQKRSKTECVDEAMSLLAKVGLSDKANSYPRHLSGGQQQRAAIARALAQRPAAILFDEPTSALDPELVGEVLKVIRDLAKEGRTMLIVTHEINFAREVSNRIIFLEKGTLIADAPPAKLFSEDAPDRFKKFISKTLHTSS